MHYIAGKAYSVIKARSGSGPGKRLYCVVIVLDAWENNRRFWRKHKN